MTKWLLILLFADNPVESLERSDFNGESTFLWKLWGIIERVLLALLHSQSPAVQFCELNCIISWYNISNPVSCLVLPIPQRVTKDNKWPATKLHPKYTMGLHTKCKCGYIFWPFLILVIIKLSYRVHVPNPQCTMF